jgi:hypothetical protein
MTLKNSTAEYLEQCRQALAQQQATSAYHNSFHPKMVDFLGDAIYAYAQRNLLAIYRQTSANQDRVAISQKQLLAFFIGEYQPLLDVARRAPTPLAPLNK